MKHPAKYTDTLLPVFQFELQGCKHILDPFAGTGKVFDIGLSANIVGVEIEPEWASMRSGMVNADALHLPFASETFDGIVTSPTYANRLADHHKATDDSHRNTYRHVLGRPLHPNNSGQLQWGDAYREFHRQAWKECWRVLVPGGRFLLNIKDHIRNGKRQHVTDWHDTALHWIGFIGLGETLIKCPGNRMGANRNLRIEYESVLLFKKPDRN